MTGPRVHELGKDINLTSKVLIELLEKYEELNQTTIRLGIVASPYDALSSPC